MTLAGQSEPAQKNPSSASVSASSQRPDATFPASSARLDTPGSRFRNWEHIGRGGSADVFRVHDALLGIDLAIKLLRSDQQQSERNRKLMLREVLVSRALRHTAICPVHDIYDGPEGFGVVMDLLEGEELSDWIAANRDRQIETFDDRLGLLLQIADALSVAHRRIVHRDLKPANIFLMNGDINRPLILDFGLSLLDKDEGTGLKGGTPRYMAPEQFDGFVDVRSDLFSFGVIAYELLTGQHPLGRARPSKITRTDWIGVDLQSPGKLSDVVSAGLDRLIMRLLSIDPDKRPQSATEIVRSLHAIIADRTGDRVRDGQNDQLTDITVPEGEYLIGSPPNVRHAAEKPMRRIKLSSYRLTETPVTNAQYLAFVRDTGAKPPPLIDDPVFGQSDHPVVMVDWNEARAFCTWTGGRLPTEAEWEVAAKAGAKAVEYPWGDQPPGPAFANFDEAVGATTPVKAYPEGRNRLGFWDMAGNVAEWCQDGYSEQAYRQLREGCEDPCHDDTTDQKRAIRGGGHEGMAHLCRCAFRDGVDQSSRRNDLGFRVAFDNG
ncbi:bifunctional serine/threonine-protein kinase/formylglycine-generating enzyme family protein [Minwuia sp.]|uniref:bifunctional serine/threonine-protein kinase/formylglycine-generating enzyme family protein n=1 Tax=Minwuia sp. TaxID=2493630 RepID=UPI003A946370